MNDIDKKLRHNEKAKEFYYRHRERLKEKIMQHYILHREERLEYAKRYRLKNKAKISVRDKLYKKNNREKVNLWTRLYRKKLGKLWKKEQNLNRRSKNGRRTLRITQMVYEDNIKRYGTRTRYLCLEPIQFGNDHLEHKIPLSRGGNNEYHNLAVSCQRCNLSKGNRLVEEYSKSKKESQNA